MEPIKIEYKSKGRDLDERTFKKMVLGINDNSLFTEPIVDLIDGKEDKFIEFFSYCKLLMGEKCIFCNRKGGIDIKYLYSNSDNEIVIPCKECLSNNIEGSTQSKQWVIWFNSQVLEEYNMNFQNGFPKMLRYKFMGRCTECDKPHDKEMIMFVDLR